MKEEFFAPFPRNTKKAGGVAVDHYTYSTTGVVYEPSGVPLSLDGFGFLPFEGFAFTFGGFCGDASPSA